MSTYSLSIPINDGPPNPGEVPGTTAAINLTGGVIATLDAACADWVALARTTAGNFNLARWDASHTNLVWVAAVTLSVSDIATISPSADDELLVCGGGAGSLAGLWQRATVVAVPA